MNSHDESTDVVLDEGMRGRIRSASIAVERERVPTKAELDIARMARSVAMTHARERTASRRRIAGVAAVGLSAAAALVVYTQQASSPAVVVAPRCASQHVAEAHGDLTAGERFQLGARARIGLGGGGVARFTAPDACGATVVLESGTVDVWAKDLAGGELRVRSGDVTVLVHGTVFRVTRDGDRTSVQVDEGLVEVRSASNASFVRPGHAVDVDGRSVTTRGLSAVERSAVHAIVVDPVAAVDVGRPTDAPRLAADLATTGDASVTPSSENAPAPPTASELLSRAETAYREGRVDDARRLFRSAGALRGVDAEAAWLRLGRLEQRAGRTAEAAAVLAEHRRRFPRGRLSAESLYLESRARRALGEGSVATALEDRLLAEHPTTPQAARVRTVRSAEP